MFRNLLSRLLTDSPDVSTLSATDADLAVAALLIRVARTDDRYTAVERTHIDQVLARRGSLDAGEAADRRAAAEMIEAEAPDTVRFTRRIKERVPLEDRMQVIGVLWEVVQADRRHHAREEAVIRLVSGLLEVGEAESGVARARAGDQIGTA